MARVDADTGSGRMTLDSRFFPYGEGVPRTERCTQTRLQAGDTSSDSYCFVD
jgi:selenium-binding protein 1